MIKRFLVAAVVAACTLPALALPSVDAVRAEVAKGHDAQAEQMLGEVLAARPDSARARYVHAEILAREGRFAQAAEEAAQARRLDPALSFTQPETFRAFEALLAREQAAAAGAHVKTALLQAPLAGTSGGVPVWVWAGGLALLALLVVRRVAAPGAPLTATAPAAAAPAAPLGPMANAGMGAAPAPFSSAPQMPVGGGGSGVLGTGLAVAGGVAAGMLAERLLEGHRDTGPSIFWTAAPATAPQETFDDAATEQAAARELAQRPIDMGNGDGWGGTDDVADPGGSGNSDGW